MLGWLPCLPPLWQLLSPYGFQPISEPGVGITPSGRSEITLLALLALAASGWRPRLGGWRSPTVWTAAFGLWVVVCSLAGGEWVESLMFAQNWIAAVCVLLVCQRLPNLSLWSLTQKLWALHLPIIVACLLSLAPVISSSESLRAAGPFQLPGVLSNWLLLLLPLVWQEVFRADRRDLPAPTLTLMLALATLVMTISRAAWLVAIVQLSLLLLLEARQPVRRMLGWAAFGVVAVAILVAARSLLPGLGLLLGFALICATPIAAVLAGGELARTTALRTVVVLLLTAGTLTLLASQRGQQPLSDQARARLDRLTATDHSASGRIQLWRAALVLSLRHPVVGVGPGRFGESYPQVQQHYYYFSDSAHGSCLELLAETGWVGGALFLASLLAYLGRTRPDPWRKPWQRGPLVGALTGALYSQVELGYHFAILWVVLAVVLALGTADAGVEPTPPPSLLARLWVLPFVLLLLFLLPLERSYTESRRQISLEDAYREARAVSDQLPAWAGPGISALQYGLQSSHPLAELQPLADRVLRFARRDAAAYQLAGEVALRGKDYSRAEKLFARSLQLDRFNQPGTYHGLFLTALAQGDLKKGDDVARQALALYDSSHWTISHPGHRASLSHQLRPLFSDIADHLSPYKQPVRTEPIYRFLLELGPEPGAMHGLGVSLWTQGRYDEARPLLEQAHQLNPAYPAPPK